MPDNGACHAAPCGDKYTATFEKAYARYYPGVFKYLFHRTGNAAVAEELAAEVFARFACQLRPLIDRGRSLPAWLHVVARNLAIDYRRQTCRTSWVPLDDRIKAAENTGPAPLAELRLESERVRAALNYLTEAQRRVIVLKFVEGCSNAEAGAILGKDENSIKSLQHRALVTLRSVLDLDA